MMRTRFARKDDEGASDEEEWRVGYEEDVDERQAELLRRLDYKASGPVKLINPWLTPTGGSSRPPTIPSSMLDTNFDLGASNQHNREESLYALFSRKPGAEGLTEAAASVLERGDAGGVLGTGEVVNKDVHNGGRRGKARQGPFATSAAVQVDQLLLDLHRSASRTSAAPFPACIPADGHHARTSHPDQHAQQQPTSQCHETPHAHVHADSSFAFLLHPPRPTPPPSKDPPNYGPPPSAGPPASSAAPPPPHASRLPATTRDAPRLPAPAPSTRPSLPSPPKRPWILTAGPAAAAGSRSPSGGKASKKKKPSFTIREGPSPSGGLTFESPLLGAGRAGSNVAAAGAQGGCPWPLPHGPQGPSPTVCERSESSRKRSGEAVQLGVSATGQTAPSARQGGQGQRPAAFSSPLPTQGGGAGADGGGGGSKLSALLGPRLPPSAGKQRTHLGPLRTITSTGPHRNLQRSGAPPAAPQAPPPTPSSAAAATGLITSPCHRTPAFITPIRSLSSTPHCTSPPAVAVITAAAAAAAAAVASHRRQSDGSGTEAAGALPMTPAPPPPPGGGQEAAPVHAGDHHPGSTTPRSGGPGGLGIAPASKLPPPDGGGGTGTRQEAGFGATGSSQKVLLLTHSQQHNYQQQQQVQQAQHQHQHPQLMLPAATSTFMTPPPAPRRRISGAGGGSCPGSVNRPNSAPATLAELLGWRRPPSTPVGTHPTPCAHPATIAGAAAPAAALAPAAMCAVAAECAADGRQTIATSPPHHPNTTPGSSHQAPHHLSAGFPSPLHPEYQQQQQHPSAGTPAPHNQREWQPRHEGTPLELMGQQASRQRAFLRGLGPLAPLGAAGRRGAGGGGGRRNVGGLQGRLQAVLANLKLLQDRECVVVTSGKPFPPPPAGSLLVEVLSRVREAHLTRASCTVRKVYDENVGVGDASLSVSPRGDAGAVNNSGCGGGGTAAVLPGAFMHVFLDSKRNDWGIEPGNRFLVLPPYKILRTTTRTVGPNLCENPGMGEGREAQGRLATTAGGGGGGVAPEDSHAGGSCLPGVSQTSEAVAARRAVGAGGGAPGAESTRATIMDGQRGGRSDCAMVLLAHMTRRVEDVVPCEE